MLRVVMPTAATAVLATGLAVAVNYATGANHSVWAWVAVVALTVGVFAVSLWVQHAPSTDRELAIGVDLRNVKTERGLRVKGVRSTGTGIRAARVRSGGDMSFEDIRTGVDNPTHP
ncbi:hypothetical protein ACWDUL_14230 [Nocardia niigatensis]